MADPDPADVRADAEQVLEQTRGLRSAADPRLVLALRLLAVVGTLVILFLLVRLTIRVGDNQTANTQALCALRADYQKRIDTSRKFLVTHPRGIPGISAGVIRTGIVNSQRTVTALGPLTCPK